MKEELNNQQPPIQFSWLYLFSQVFAVIFLFYTLKIGLLPALLAGLIIYHIVEVTTPALGRFGITPAIGQIATLTFIGMIVISSIIFVAMGLVSFLNSNSGEFIALLQRMADIISTARSHLPMWAHDYLPDNVVDLQTETAAWLRSYARQLSTMGRSVGISIIYILMGFVIGGMIAFTGKITVTNNYGPLARHLSNRASILHRAFSRIVFSQIKISAINTFLTGIFLAVILPAFGHPLPFTKIMIAVTFIVGLMPVIGNIISNTVIVLISLSSSPVVAFSSLGFLVVIHKFEYFLNANIIGNNIHARAWELLLAMLVMEASFGISGLIAAPIFYAYIKDELVERGLI